MEVFVLLWHFTNSQDWCLRWVFALQIQALAISGRHWPRPSVPQPHNELTVVSWDQPPSPPPLSLLRETPHAELLCLCQSRKTSSNISLSPVCKTVDADLFYLRATFIDIYVACDVSKCQCTLKKVCIQYLKWYSNFSAFSVTKNILYPGGISTAYPAQWSHVKLARALPIMRNPQNGPYDHQVMLRK